jgi:hypothetical protein
MAYPAGLPAKYRWRWDHPWSFRARHSPRFKKWIRDHTNRFSPHFTKEEARCKDGTYVPASLAGNASRVAFKLEKLRHKLGDRSIPILSWYRSPSHNAAVGGASQSRHMSADAVDIPSSFVQSVGTSRFDYWANRVWWNGGYGQYPSGSRHGDTRGYRARWTSF